MTEALSFLMSIGKLQKSFNVFGITFEMQTLSSKDNIDALAMTQDYDNETRIYALKVALLSKAIISINEIKPKNLEAVIEIINNLQQPIVDTLFEKYEELQQKQNKALISLNKKQTNKNNIVFLRRNIK